MEDEPGLTRLSRADCSAALPPADPAIRPPGPTKTKKHGTAQEKPSTSCCGNSGFLLMADDQAAALQAIVSARYGARALVICPHCAVGRARFVAWSGLPDEARAIRLDGAALRTLPAQTEALGAIARLLAARRGWLALAGDYGVGKTTLIYAALNHLADVGVFGRYITAPALLDYLREGIHLESPGSRLRGLMDAQALAVDELDKFQSTPWADEAIFKLFDARYRAHARQITLIGYNADGAARIPPFLASRMHDGRFQHIVLGGSDIRAKLTPLDPWDRGEQETPWIS